VAFDGDNDVERASSCFHLALTEGNWTLVASHPAYGGRQVRLSVPERRQCLGNFQTVELRLNRRQTASAAEVGPSLPPSKNPSPAEPASPPASAPAPNVPPAPEPGAPDTEEPMQL
jgi:hypothetical protein